MKTKVIDYTTLPVGAEVSSIKRSIDTCECGKNGTKSVWKDWNATIVRHKDKLVNGKPVLHDYCLNGVSSFEALHAFNKAKEEAKPEITRAPAKRVQKPWKNSLRKSPNPQRPRPEVLCFL